MTVISLTSALPADFNHRVFLIYIAAFLTLLILGLGYMLYKGKYIYLGLILAAPILILLLTQPKLAVGQFVLALFYSRLMLAGQPWLFADISGFILIAAALLDLSSDSKLPDKLPRLSMNFIFLLIVIFIAGIFSYQPEAAISPFGRITLVFLYFLAMYRLSGKVSVAWSLNLFFWISVIHSFIAVLPFLASGGTLRSYGTAPVEMPMLALVVATAKYIWAEKGKAWIYLAGMALIFLALLSAQFRSQIILGAAMSLLVVLFSRRRAGLELCKVSNKSGGSSIEEFTQIIKRPLHLLAVFLLMFVLAIILNPQIFSSLAERFGNLATARPSGSILARILLWKQAWTLFIANPMTGFGPGLFMQIQSIDTAARLDFHYWFVRGLSAHNLFLHYLAETGIMGGIALLAIMINQWRLSLRAWLYSSVKQNLEASAILLGMAATILITTLTEGSWMWGQSSIIFAFFTSLIVRNYNNIIYSKNS